RARVCVAVCELGWPASVTVTVNDEPAGAVGVPVICPLGARLRPAGRAPVDRAHVYAGVPPLAASVALYGWPTVAGGKVLDATSGAGAPASTTETVRSALWPCVSAAVIEKRSVCADVRGFGPTTTTVDARPRAQVTDLRMRLDASGDLCPRKVHPRALRTRAVSRTVPPSDGSEAGAAASALTAGRLVAPLAGATPSTAAAAAAEAITSARPRTDVSLPVAIGSRSSSTASTPAR